MNEQLSAFLDNEATRDESDAVVSALLRDERLRDSWTRQHRVREALRASPGDPTVAVDAGFTARVMRAIDEQPAHVAPDTAPAAVGGETERHANVVAMTDKQRPRGHWRRNVAGMAVAASAAGFALFVTQPLQLLDTVVRTPAAQTTSVASAQTGGTSELSFETSASTGTSGFAGFNIAWNLAGGLASSVASHVNQARAKVDQWSVSDPTLANRLNNFLAEHNGLARGYGLGAATPAFVRAATYGQGVSR